MKKICSVAILLLICFMFTGCTAIILGVTVATMGTRFYNDPAEYGKDWLEDVPEFLPTNIDEYEVVTYSYTLYEYFDTCYEIFLEINATQEQFDDIISSVKSAEKSFIESETPYAEGYFEIVFEDIYERQHGEVIEKDDGFEHVGYACIEKVIYNPQSRKIVFVCIHAHDTNVHDVEHLRYFYRFALTPEQYVEYLPKVDKETE